MATVQNIAVPPHNLAAERSVLGAVLLDERHLQSLIIEEHLKPDHFFREQHGAIFAAMLELYESDRKIDHLTVAEALRHLGKLEDVGGPEPIEELAGWVPAAGNAREYGRIVRDNAQKRALLTATYEIQADVLAGEAPTRELVERAERSMLEVAHDESQKKIRTISDILHEETDKLHRLSITKTALTGTPSGFKDLDEKTGGFQPGNLIILAARPSMGKSALVTNMAENASLQGHAVALFSLEMSESELAQRFVASQARIKGDDLRRGRVAEARWQKILDACQRLAQAPLWVDDSSDTGVLEVRAKSRRLHGQVKGGLGMIIVDYLQLMRHEGRVESRVEQVGQISRGLKGLARELNVPVIALSQLSRAVEQRGGEKKPILSDLRECVTGDTPVLLADGSRVTIGQLVGTQPEVLAVDGRYRIVPARSDLVWKVGRRPILRMTLASGRVLRGTSRHRILSAGGWRRLGEISPGERVAVASRLPDPAQPDHWPEERVVLLGQLLGSGERDRGGGITLATGRGENMRAAADAAAAGFGSDAIHRQQGDVHHLRLAERGARWTRAGLLAWIDELELFTDPCSGTPASRPQRIPPAAFNLAADQVELLLRHLWAAMGSISVSRAAGALNARITLTTDREPLAGDVRALLMRLGIAARMTASRSRSGTSWSVTIGDAVDQRVFLKRVGAFGELRAVARQLELALAAQSPLELHDARAATAGGGAAARGFAAGRGFHAARSATGDHIVARESSGGKPAGPPAEPAAADVAWERVISIEQAGEEDVFDLTVPGPACWLSDGIVSHNSGQIEQDADLVMFIYREEYYEKDSERAGEADIIIAKHRNGPVGEVVLSFQKDYPKFMNYAGERFAQ